MAVVHSLRYILFSCVNILPFISSIVDGFGGSFLFLRLQIEWIWFFLHVNEYYLPTSAASLFHETWGKKILLITLVEIIHNKWYYVFLFRCALISFIYNYEFRVFIAKIQTISHVGNCIRQIAKDGIFLFLTLIKNIPTPTPTSFIHE